MIITLLRRTFCISLMSWGSCYGEVIESKYDMIAHAEVDAWKGYYSKSLPEVFKNFKKIISLQYNLIDSWTIEQITYHFAFAVMKFAEIPNDSPPSIYETEALPLVVTAYERLKEVTSATWDAAEAAKWELSWWIARRNAKTLNPENVGESIARLYTTLYGPHDERSFIRAAYLRSVAARYRDCCQHTWGGIKEKDWNIAYILLVQSYQELALGIETNEKSRSGAPKKLGDGSLKHLMRYLK